MSKARYDFPEKQNNKILKVSVVVIRTSDRL